MGSLDTQPLKGFRDFPPSQQIRREKLFETIRQVFRKHGFDPIETPSLEYWETLSGKYGEEGEKLIYRFKDYGGREVGLRYDLTVPLARFYARFHDRLPKPFKRYQIQPVWRADKPQRGRFREFYQCDIDIVASDSILADAEIVSTIDDALKSIGIGNYTIRINNRKVVKALVENMSIPDRENEYARILDKLDKVGKQGVLKELMDKGFDKHVLEETEKLISTSYMSLDELANVCNNRYMEEALRELEELGTYLGAFGVSWKLDATLVRGLDYYTGNVFEVILEDANVGSIASGGRYDHLIGMFMKEDVPATGGSLGIDRILSVVGEGDERTYSHVLIAYMEDTLVQAIELSKKLRENGINVDMHPDGVNLRKQLRYAHRKGIPFVIILGTDELESGTYTLRDMESGAQYNLGEKELLEKLKSVVAV